MSNPAEFDPRGSYDVICNQLKVAELHQRRFMEGPRFELCTGEVVDERLYQGLACRNVVRTNHHPSQ
ncbi:hypothetical protein ACFQDN_22520 [Pseudomonas asuensis]